LEVREKGTDLVGHRSFHKFLLIIFSGFKATYSDLKSHGAIEAIFLHLGLAPTDMVLMTRDLGGHSDEKTSGSSLSVTGVQADILDGSVSHESFL
jgi:hypothetical protein